MFGMENIDYVKQGGTKVPVDKTNTYFVNSSMSAIGKGLEAYNLKDRPSSYVSSRSYNVTANENFSGMLNTLDFATDRLPGAAEKYDISPNLADYVLTFTVSMPSDLPNRNGIAFRYEDLTDFHPDATSNYMYKTWLYKPVCYEHDNDIPMDIDLYKGPVLNHTDRCKGLIFDCIIKRIPNTCGDIHKVVKLLGIDRTKDPALAKEVLLGRRRDYSMGANVSQFTCSICRAPTATRPCPHVIAGPATPTRIINNQLAFKNVVFPVGKECSSVAIPAYSSASDSPLIQSID